ncbi:unnamed protein product [Rotaria magnacalcarata]|uniref:OTU domain-containing protein n=1 Tax=Rotaria magnacalcarata TaxID=392030 RepID=A0A816SG17_9BILA|nr:unnamed protein product [Rotaria magnacalcarata]CAF4228837.1 unnamed protein product [Rotaria magnacalcarata]
MISLVETWTKPSDSLEIEDFKIVHRRDCHDVRKPSGRYEYSGKDHIEYSSIKVDDICIISVYNSPNSSFDVQRRHMNEVITISKRFCDNIIVVGDFNINLKIKINNKSIECMKSFGFSSNNTLNKDSTNAKTQIDYCFTNMKDVKSGYFESLTSFHKSIWIRKYKILSKSYFHEIKNIHKNVTSIINDEVTLDDQFGTMDIDDKFVFESYETDDKNEQIDLDMSFQLEDLKVNEPFDTMETEEKSFPTNYEIMDSHLRNILDHFLLLLEFDKTAETTQISNQTRIIDDIIEKSPFITVHNKDRSVKIRPKIEYSVEAFDALYAPTHTTGDGNCLYSSLSIIKIGPEELTHSMRLLAVNAVINNSNHSKTICRLLNYSFEEQLKRTATNEQWGGEVQIHALSIALRQPIYSYVEFLDNPKRVHYIPSNISTQDLIKRFDDGTAGSHFKYIGYKSDMNKPSLCIHFTGIHYDALLPFSNNPHQVVPKNDIIDMSL